MTDPDRFDAIGMLKRAVETMPTTEPILKLCDEIEALLKATRPFTYIYHFRSPVGGEYLSLSSDAGNGHKPFRTTLVYAEDAIIRNAAQLLIDAARIGARYIRMSESGETLGDALDLREENMALRDDLLKETKYKREFERDWLEASDEVIKLRERIQELEQQVKERGVGGIQDV